MLFQQTTKPLRLKLADKPISKGAIVRLFFV